MATIVILLNKKEVLIMSKKVIFFLSLSILFVCSSAFADVIKLKFANYFPPTQVNAKVMERYCEELNKLLAGKVQVMHFLGGSLLTAPKMAAGVASGVADMGLSHIAYTRGRFPVSEIMELPIGFSSSWIATKVVNDFYEKFKPKEWNEYKVLMLTGCTPNLLQTIKNPVRTLEDMKGLKIRGVGRVADIVKSLGAIPIPLETVDLYDSLRRGVVDGVFISLETMKGFGWGEVIKHITASWRIGSVYCFYVVMNKKKWDSLSPDVQKTIMDVSKKYNDIWSQEYDKADFEGVEFNKGYGGQILYLSNEEHLRWVQATQPVVDLYKKDLISKGYKEKEIDRWLSFTKERINYWTEQSKAMKIKSVIEFK